MTEGRKESHRESVVRPPAQARREVCRHTRVLAAGYCPDCRGGFWIEVQAPAGSRSQGTYPAGGFHLRRAYGRSSTRESAGLQNQWLQVRFLPSMRSTTLRGERACVLTNAQRNTKERGRPPCRRASRPRACPGCPVVPGRAAPGLLAPTGRATPLQGEGFPVRIRGGPRSRSGMSRKGQRA
jgi:hypothetical protein